MEDQFDKERALSVNENHKSRMKVLYQPFKATAFSKPLFDCTLLNAYKSNTQLKPRKIKQQIIFALHKKPFKRSNPPKQGYNKTISQITYMEEKEELDRTGSHLIKIPWKPGGEVNKSTFSKTIEF